MKTNQRIHTLIVVFGLLILSACSGRPDSLLVVPEDAGFVAKANLHQLAKKGKLSEIEELKLFKMLKKELKNENRSASKIMNKYLKNLKSLGINFKEDVIVFQFDEGDDESFYGISASLSDRKKFAKFIEDDLELSVDKGKTYYYYYDKGFGLAWDYDKLVLLFPLNYRSRSNIDIGLEYLMGLKEEKTIWSNKSFKSAYKKSDDISFWMNFDMVTSRSGWSESEMEDEIGFSLNGNSMAFSLNFEKGAMEVDFKFMPNEELKKKLAEANLFNKKFNKQLFNYLPNQSFATMGMSINPEGYLSYIKGFKQFSDFQEKAEESLGVSVKEMVKALKGSIIFSLYGFEMQKLNYLSWGYGFDENKATLMDEQYLISMAGMLSEAEKASLNEGNIIPLNSYSKNYAIDIREHLAQGLKIEDVIEKDLAVTWYEGGWAYGKYKPVTTEELVPLMGLVLDINDAKMIKKLIAKAENLIEKKGNIYTFKMDDKFETYIAFTEDNLYIGNDIKVAKALANGGIKGENFATNKNISSVIAKNPMYFQVNLNIADYPKNIQKQAMSSSYSKLVLNAIGQFAKNMEIYGIDESSSKIKINMQDSKTNSLEGLILHLDKNYKKFTDPSTKDMETMEYDFDEEIPTEEYDPYDYEDEDTMYEFEDEL